MSWKIYNGFILKNITKLEDALEYFKSLIDDFNNEADDYWKGMIISHAIASYDNDCAAGEKPNKNYFSTSRSLFWNIEQETSANRRKSITDVRVGVSLTPAKIEGKKRIIGMLFCDNRRLHKKFFELPEIEEYGYYDNADEPENITIKEWNKRGKVWKKIFDKYSTVSKAMFSYDIISDNESMRMPNINEEDFKKYSISFEERFKGAVNDRLLKNKSFSNFHEYNDYIKSDEAIESKKLIEPIVRDRLTLDLSLNDLIKNAEE